MDGARLKQRIAAIDLTRILLILLVLAAAAGAGFALGLWLGS